MKKILVVDNHPVMLKFMSGLLEKNGHEVMTAHDGYSAMEVLKSFHPDMFFLDLIMENIRGDKLCRVIRSKPEYKDSFIAILSGIAAESKDNYNDCGADIFIAKGPFDKLSGHVLDVLDRLETGRINSLAGKLIGCEGIYKREVTNELLESNRHYELTVNHMSEGLLELIHQSKIVYINPAAVSIIGIAEEKLLATDFLYLFNKSDGKKVKALIDAASDMSRTMMLEDLVEINKRSILLKIIPTNESKQKSFLAILLDLSQQKSLEAQLQRAQKMEAVGTLAGGVAHDLNNTLSGIISYPDLMLLKIPQDSPLRRPLMTMKESGNKAAAIVQDLLTLARRGVAIKDVVNLNEIAKQYFESPEHKKLRSFHPKVVFEVHLEADLMNNMGSSVHLFKTIMNLISNAAESIVEDGRIIFTTENCYVDTSIKGYDNIEEGEYVTIEISDTGTGIAPEDVERIFEPFYTKKKMGRSGTGLGMAVVWGTVKDHKGYVDIQSLEGSGTVVSIYLPVTRREIVKESEPSPIADYMGNKESIMVIDDVREQIEIASNMLETLGYEVNTALSGKSAVEFLKTNKVDLVLLDMIMEPGMDGLDTYRKIIEIRPDQKAIIVSGFSESNRIKDAQKLGVGLYLKKPYSLENIGMAIKKVLQ